MLCHFSGQACTEHTWALTSHTHTHTHTNTHTHIHTHTHTHTHAHTLSLSHTHKLPCRSQLLSHGPSCLSHSLPPSSAAQCSQVLTHSAIPCCRPLLHNQRFVDTSPVVVLFGSLLLFLWIFAALYVVPFRTISASLLQICDRLVRLLAAHAAVPCYPQNVDPCCTCSSSLLPPKCGSLQHMQQFIT